MLISLIMSVIFGHIGLSEAVQIPISYKKDDLVAKIDKYIPISIVIISIFIALIA